MDQVQEWAHGFVVGSGRKSDMLFSEGGESGLQSGMAECLAGTADARARWHALRWVGAGACWARKPNVVHFK